MQKQKNIILLIGVRKNVTLLFGAKSLLFMILIIMAKTLGAN